MAPKKSRENLSMIIKPPAYLQNCSSPLIFLAGPIQGTWKWQDQAIELIQRKAPELSIASPRRDLEWHGDFTHDMYLEQVDWESHYLKKAGEHPLGQYLSHVTLF